MTAFTPARKIARNESQPLTERGRIALAHTCIRFYRRREQEGRPVSLQQKHRDRFELGEDVFQKARFQIYNARSADETPVCLRPVLIHIRSTAHKNILGIDWLRATTQEGARIMYKSIGFNTLREREADMAYRLNVEAEFGVTFTAEATVEDIERFVEFETHSL